MGSSSPRLSIIQGQLYIPRWSDILAITDLALSMTVNALVTGLIVFRILKVFQEVKTSTAVTGGSTLRRVIFIIIESGVALFSIQLARLVATVLSGMDEAVRNAYYLIVGIHEMLNVIIRSVIVTLSY